MLKGKSLFSYGTCDSSGYFSLEDIFYAVACGLVGSNVQICCKHFRHCPINFNILKEKKKETSAAVGKRQVQDLYQRLGFNLSVLQILSYGVLAVFAHYQTISDPPILLSCFVDMIGSKN